MVGGMEISIKTRMKVGKNIAYSWLDDLFLSHRRKINGSVNLDKIQLKTLDY